MLNDVTHKISDGLMGNGNNSGTGVHIKIGASPIVSTEPIIITNSRKLEYIREKLGLSPLADAVMDSVENGSAKVICIPVKPGTDGTITPLNTVAADNSGTMTLSGKPNNTFDIMVMITGNGVLNTASFKYSINGGYTYSEEMSVPLSGSYDIPDTGLDITFVIADEQEYKAGDLFHWATTAPQLTNENVIAGVEKIKNIKDEAEFVHIVGSCAEDTWASVSELQKTLQGKYHKPLFFIMESFENTYMSMAEYVEALKTARKNIRNFEIQVCPARAMYLGMDGITRDVNLAGVACGLYAKTAVNRSIGETAEISISEEKIYSLLPSGLDDDAIDELDDIGYLTFRQYDGLAGYYVNNARMLGPDGTDYKYAEDVRVLNKIIRETRKEALLQLQSDIDLENPMADLKAKIEFIKAPLDRMVNDKEISSAEITLPDNAAETILTSEKLFLTVRYVQRGIIRSIEIDVGKRNPYAS